MIDLDKDYALSCTNVSKEFYILDKRMNWRIVFRNPVDQLTSYKALSNVSLNVPKGKFVGILGRNGAGKSTLLRILGGVYGATAGIVNTTGEASSLFEMGGMGNRSLTGCAYAHRYLEILGIKKLERNILVDNIKEFSELGKDFYKPIYSYSSGMSARLYFSTATELQHKIYLVDELLSVGDEHFQAKCWKRLRDRFTNGASGVLVTHDWSAVLKLCELSFILEKGQITASGKSEEIVQKYLQLPLPTKEYLEILPDPEGYFFESGKDCVIRFDVLVKRLSPVAMNYTLELFRGGYGWENIIMNDDFVPLPFKLGINSVSITIKALPLTEGNYYINLFFKSLDKNIDSLALDSRSWTYGNGIKIQVKGNSTKEIVALAWKNEIKAVQHVRT